MNAPETRRADQRRTDTREQLRSVALQLFAEKGYDGTSLREIAERLGVTKAAVYYHFRSKEEILVSLIEDFLTELDELVRWANDQPRDAAFRTEVLRRYSELLSAHGVELARFVQQGPGALRELAKGMNLYERLLALIELLTAPGDPVAGRLRAQAALISLQVGTLQASDHGVDEALVRATALSIATEILSPSTFR